jgi:hypothetical protein
MSANIDLYEDLGAPLSGRGTTLLLLDDWNLKASTDPAYVYYPTGETTSAPLRRPFNTLGAQTLSYKKYLSFKIDGTYARLKNIRMKLSIDGEAQSNGAQLFYKMTSTYAAPDNAYDGDMMLLSTADGTGLLTATLHPMLSTTGPNAATSRQVVYGPNQTLYTSWLVVQMRINNNATIGNSAEFNLKLEAYEYD